MSAGELARNVERHLGRTVFVSPTLATRIIEAWVEPTRPGWRVVLRASDANGIPLGQRDLASVDRDCASIDRALTIAVGLLAQEAEGATRPPLEPLPTPSVPSSPISTDVPSSVSQSPTAPPSQSHEVPQPPNARSTNGSFGPTFDLGWGVLPTTAAGAGIRGLFQLPRWGGVELAARFWLPQETDRSDAAGVFSRIDFSLGFCPLVLTRDVASFALCAGAAGILLTAQGFGSAGSEIANSPFIEGYVRALGRVRLIGPVSLDLAAALGAPTRRWSFYHRFADGSEDDLWTMPAINGSASIGAVLYFGP